MTDLEIFTRKAHLLAEALNLVRRCEVRPPATLLWLVTMLGSRSAEVPPGHVGPYHANIHTPPDKLARTFCALEDLEAWLTRVDSGMQRHQQEMERQAAPKLARLRMAKEFAEKNVASEETPF